MSSKQLKQLIEYSNGFIQRLPALFQISCVAGGTIVAQTVNIITIPIIARLYTPADYGIMALYSSVIAVLVEISGLRYYLAIPLPKQKRYAQALVMLSFLLQFILVLFLAILLFYKGDIILTFIKMNHLIQYKYWIPVGLFTIGIYRIVTQGSIRESLFKTLGFTKITQSFSGVFVKILFGSMGLRPTGLLIGTIIGQASGSVTLIKILLKTQGINFNLKNIKRVLIRYRAFPFYNIWVGLFNTFGRQLPQIFLSSFYDVKYAGIYAMAASVLSIPAAFVGEAIGNVFLQRASNAKYTGNIAKIAFKTYDLLLTLGCFPITVISMFSPWILSVILGKEWGETGVYAMALAPWVAYTFAVSSLGSLFSIMDYQKQALWFEIVYLISRILVFALTKMIFNSPLVTICVFSISNCILLIIQQLYLFKKLGITYLTTLFLTFKVVAETLLLSLIPYIIFIFYSHIIGLILIFGAILIYIKNLCKTCRKYRII